jgi:hypothetical protein
MAARLNMMRPPGNEMIDVNVGLGLEAKIGLDLKDEMRLRVNLETEDDALYVGTLYVGAPKS